MGIPPTLPSAAPPRARKVARSHRLGSARGANLLVALLATFLLAIALGGYWYHRQQLASLASEDLRLLVTGPSTLQAGVAASYGVSTTAVTGAPMPAHVELALYAPDGQRLWAHKEKSDERGLLAVTVPGELKVPSGARLEVLAVHRDKLERIDTRLIVEPTRYATQLALDKPLYRAGETVRYRSVTLSRFGLAADGEMRVHYEILDPSGAVMAGSQRDGVTRHGISSDTFVIPAESVGGPYTLVARSADGKFPAARQEFVVRHRRWPRWHTQLEFARDRYVAGDKVVADFLAEQAEGSPAAGIPLQVTASVDGRRVCEKTARTDQAGAAHLEFVLPEKIAHGNGQLQVTVDDGSTRESVAKTIPIEPDKVEVAFYPEGGQLVADLENRVYFVGRTPAGGPVSIKGVVVDSSGHSVAIVEATHAGRGTFSFTPLARQPYRLRITSPAGTKNEPLLPDVSADRKVVLTTGSGVFAAGKPLEFTVRAANANLPLVAAAVCRGVLVGQQALLSTLENGGANPVSIPLGDQAGGVIRLTVYDYSVSPPSPVADRLVYRKTPGLKIRASGCKERYSPGEEVKLALTVTDENGQPVPADLGVAVVDDNASGQPTPLSPFGRGASSSLPAGRGTGSSLPSPAGRGTGLPLPSPAGRGAGGEGVPAFDNGCAASMTAAFLLRSQLEHPEDLEDLKAADEYLADSPDARVALDLLLGTREVQSPEYGVRSGVPLSAHTRGLTSPARLLSSADHPLPTAEDSRLRLADPPPADLPSAPPAVFDNLKQIHDNYAESLAAYRADRIRVLNTLTTISFFGGLGLMLLVVMLGLLRIVSGVHWWMPAVSSTLCCLIIGAILFDSNRLMPSQETVTPFVPFQLLPEAGAASGNGATLADEHPAGADRAAKLDRPAGLDSSATPGNRSENGNSPASRSQSLFWRPWLEARDGRANISFTLPDAPSTFRLGIDAHAGGRLGSGRVQLVSRIPFRLVPTLPPEINAGDRLDLPLTAISDAESELPVKIRFECGDLLKLAGPAERTVLLPPGKQALEHYALEAVGEKGNCELSFRGSILPSPSGRGAGGEGAPLADVLTASLRVVPPGFPKRLGYRGRMDEVQEIVVNLPESWVPNSLEVKLNLFPSVLAELQCGLEGVVQEPGGYFDQSAAVCDLAAKLLATMREQEIANPRMILHVKQCLAIAAEKRKAYEGKQQGLAPVAGDSGGVGSMHPRVLALQALAEDAKANPRPINEGKLIVKRDGQLIAQRPVTAGRQEVITIDGLEANLHPGRNRLTLSLSGKNRMAYALDVAYRDHAPANDENCPLRLDVQLAEMPSGGLSQSSTAGPSQSSPAGLSQPSSGALSQPSSGALSQFSPGDCPNFRPSENGTVPLPQHENATVPFRIQVGQPVTLKAELTNTTDESQPMAIAILGLPAGLEPRGQQLEELRKSGSIDHYEIAGRELICYWRTVPPQKKIVFAIDLVAAIPGKYTGPPSQTYLYHTPEQRQWAKPLEVEIAK